MRESELARAKTCFVILALGAGCSLLKGLLSGSVVPLDSLLSLAAAVLDLVAIWRLREVEYGYRRAFRVEVTGMVAILVGTVLVFWVAYANAEGLAIVLALLVTAIPVVFGGIFQYLFCVTTEQVMGEVGAARQAAWSGWMWKIYALYAVVELLGAVLVLIKMVPELFATMLDRMSLAIYVLQIVYYFMCSRALSAE